MPLRSLWAGVWAVLVYLHAAIIAPIAAFWEETILGGFEEYCTSLVRQAFEETTRFLNGLSSWFLSLFNVHYRDTLRQSWKNNAWQRWWMQVQSRPSTLNELVANWHATPADAGGGPAPSSVGGAPTQTAGITAQPESHASKTNGVHANGDAPGGRAHPAGAGAAGADANYYSTLPYPQTQNGGRAAVPEMSGAAMGGPAAGSYSTWPRLWGRPKLDGLDGAAAAAPPAAMAAARRVPGSKAGRGKAPGNPLIGRGPASMFLQDTGLNQLGSVKGGGLLEDAKVQTEMAVARAFHSARSSIRALFGLPPLRRNEPLAAAGRGVGAAAAASTTLRSQPPATMPPAALARSGPMVHATSQLQGLHGSLPAALTPGTAAAAPPSRSHSFKSATTLSTASDPTGVSAPEKTSSRGWSLLNPWSWVSGKRLPSSSSSRGRGQMPLQGGGARVKLSRSKSAHSPNVGGLPDDVLTAAGAELRTPQGAPLRRVNSFAKLESVCQHLPEVSSAADIIRMAGYPLEVHTVTTDDGYILQMERLPRHRCRDVVFFMHGVLDTSMAWVSAGVTGSQAFASWDAGFDVWLGNSRSNAPLRHQDPAKRGGCAYWQYNINHMGLYDIAAQVDHIHNVKCAEMGTGQVALDLDHMGPLAGAFFRSSPPLAPRQAQPQHGNAAGEAAWDTDGGNSVARSAPSARLWPAASITAPSESPAPVRRTATGPSVAVTLPSGVPSGALRSATMRGSKSDADLARLASSGAPSSLYTAASVMSGSGDSMNGVGLDDTWQSVPREDASSSTSGADVGGAGEGVVGEGAGLQVVPAAATAVLQPSRQSTPSPTESLASYNVQHNSRGNGGGGGLGAVPGSVSSVSVADNASASQCFYVDGQLAVAAVPVGPSGGAAGGAISSHPLEEDGGRIASAPAAVAAAPAAGTLPAYNDSAAAPTAATPALVENSVTLSVPASGGRPQQSFTLQVKTQAFGSTPASGSVPASPVSAPILTPAQQQQHSEHASQQGGQDAFAPGTPPMEDGAQLLLAAGARTLHRRAPYSEAAAAACSPFELSSGTPFSLQGTANRNGGVAAAPTTAAVHSNNHGVQRGVAQQHGTLRATTAPLATRPAPLANNNNLLASEQMQRSPPAGPPAAVLAPVSGIPHTAAPPSVASLPATGATHAAAIKRSSSTTQVKLNESLPVPTGPGGEPYRLRAVAHSLGGMSMLIYLVARLREGTPHRIHRLVLLTPAGFHDYLPLVCQYLMYLVPWVAAAIRMVWRSFACGLFVPTFIGRALTFKLARDVALIPGLGELTRLALREVLNGDISQWDRALLMPHYNAKEMPAMSLDQVIHLTQSSKSGCFRLYDYGPRGNVKHYGQRTPPDVAAEYWRINIPVNLVAGRRDGIIPPCNIRKHHRYMKDGGVDVTYKEFDFGHLDFTFVVKEDLKMYLMRLLRR